MDLTAIPGVGPAYRERLQQAGIRDVAALARVPDLSSLAEWTSIPPSRLAGFQAHALRVMDRTPREEDESGLVLDMPPRAARKDPALLLRKAGIRAVAFAGALGAMLRSREKNSA